MESRRSTFRLTDRDNEILEALANELAVSKTDVVRAGIRLLRRDGALLEEIKAASYARAFLARLRDQYGRSARISYDMGADPPRLTIGPPIGEHAPLDVEAKTRELEDGMIALDLVDLTTGIEIRNAYVTDGGDPKHLVIPLEYLWVAAPTALPGDREVQALPDGRSVVGITEEDGTTRRLVLDHRGSTKLLEHEPQATIAGGS